MTDSPTGLPLILKRPNWPITDQIAWDALFTEGDILDGSGPCVRWSEGSRRKREQTYGHWLGFLSGLGPLGVPPDVTDRATLEAVVAFIEKELARCSVRTA
jgi:integrase/recombinase XerD